MASQQGYAGVAARLREEVMLGVWRLGQLLPGENHLAERYGVNRNTIVRALVVLRDEGVIITEKGVGSRVASVPLVTTVPLGPGDTVTSRMPDDAEQRRLGISPGVPVLVVTRAAGGQPELYDAALHRAAPA